ncbi:uncharacterized protein LOC120631864 [Pararge aegeria]|uniref:uncharacterized protein LOC120631864 n=1 Tax=Pararge aegeria TaxID=116150 RepID=UPI0019D26A64|nr:uncharacterized protein LOC120631864 [Pararge aegeria]
MMLRSVYIIVVFSKISLVDSQCCGNGFSIPGFNMEYINNKIYNPYLDDDNDSGDEQSRDEYTRDVFKDLANSLIDAENELRQYCDKNEKAVEILNTEEYTCSYHLQGYEESSIYIRIRHRIMRVIAESKAGVRRKVLDDVKIVPDSLQTGEATYDLKDGILKINIPLDRMKSDTCQGNRRDTFVVPYNIYSLLR